jgi:hypothetical protein
MKSKIDYIETESDHWVFPKSGFLIRKLNLKVIVKPRRGGSRVVEIEPS